MLVTSTTEEKIKAYVIATKSGEKLTEYFLSEIFIMAYEDTAIMCTSWDQFLIYDGKCFKHCRSKDLQRHVLMTVQKFVPSSLARCTSQFLRSVSDLILTRFPVRVTDLELGHHLIAFKDKIVNTNTWEVLDHSPAGYCFKYIDCSTEDFQKPAPLLNKYLETTLVDGLGITDPSLIDLYQEMCGSIFSANQAANKAFFLYGEGSNGKSVTTEGLLLSLFDERLVSSASLQTLSSRFGSSKLVGKVLNVCSEEESQYFQNTIFKILVTGELMDAERKYTEGFEYHNFAKLFFSTNNFPKFSSLDYSMRRRIIIIPFLKKFAGDEIDYDLKDKLRTEKAQFVWFAFQGLKRLQQNHFQFTPAKAANEAMDALQTESSSVARYVTEVVHFSVGAKPARIKDFYQYYRDWCKENGFLTVSSARFVKDFSGMEMVQRYKVVENKAVCVRAQLPQDPLPPVIQGTLNYGEQ